jgi:hypothetical protein
MLPMILCGISILAAGAALPATTETERTCLDGRPLRRDLRAAREELSELRGLAAAHPDYMTRRQMTRKVDEVRRLLERLAAALDEAEDAPPAVAPPSAMAPDRFESLLAAMQASNFDEGKLQILREAAGINHFSVEQLKQVMERFSFSAGKIQAALALHPRLVDPQSFFQVYEALPFEADRKKLRESLGR